MSRKRKREIRQRRTIMDNGHMRYMDVDLIPLYETHRGMRSAPAQESSVIQKNLNDKNSKRLFRQKATHNFGPDDYFLTLIYKDKFLPATWRDAGREVDNFIRRYNDLRRRMGLPRTKYMIVTECTVRKSGVHRGKLNFHHHLLLSGGVDRNLVEGLWRRRRGTGEREGELIGYPNSKRLYLNEDGIGGLMMYFFGEEKQEAKKEAGVTRPKHKRQWRGSKNLVPPKTPRPNNTRWSDSKVFQLAGEIQNTGRANPHYWESQFPGYRFSRCEAGYNEVTGRWSIYVRFHKRL